MNNYTDIYYVEETDTNSLFIVKPLNLEKINKSFKKMSETTVKLYLFNNLYIQQDIKTNSRKFERQVFSNYNIGDNIITINTKLENVSQLLIPNIQEYDDIITRKIISYDKGINVIIDNNSIDETMFIRSQNIIKTDDVIQFIQ